MKTRSSNTATVDIGIMSITAAIGLGCAALAWEWHESHPKTSEHFSMGSHHHKNGHGHREGHSKTDDSATPDN